MSNQPSPIRLRRLRRTPAIRRLVTETDLYSGDLILPLFVREDIAQEQEISAMPGVYQHTISSLEDVVRDAIDAGVGGVMLFGVPTFKDALGTQATDPRGILNRAIKALKNKFGDEIVIMADTCLDEFTDHGHCGVLDKDGHVDNDRTNEIYARMAVSQAEAGVDFVAPSGMMDGQVRVIREALDDAGFQDVGILAYAAKYASAFYGPFREAVNSSLQGDRRSYQQDPSNRREALHECALDLQEGADIVLVKPAMSYLDILSDVSQVSQVPVAAYQVSGEYSMIEAAAAQGWIDRQRAISESLISIKRAGADIILTYYALEVARWLNSTEA